ncbi:hypothetical protein FGIG_03067 [Fasciola gigantica]|uniref:MMS19 nucleotide excision repair protein n=1 Tax=Fasciola gigantica TaxID=46835 RepID=A0A504YIU0_FASGI|nr:hypothetical protein FGIG_03067 [Fasciola gigantica]
MQSEFVKGYLQAIDGERDPENLLLIFEMNLIVIENFPVDELKDDIFEIMSVYFPIDFSPPPGGGVAGVTREALARRLHCCLFACRLFAAHQLLPLLCEKADADWSQGRLDALSLLADCLHGQLHFQFDDELAESSKGMPVPLNHVSSYLVLIVPLLAKIINLHTKSNKLQPLAIACMTGLVHCYTTQAGNLHQLRDFVAVTCRILGLEYDPTKGSPVLADAKSPSDKLVHFLSEIIRYTSANGKVTRLFLSHLLPYFGASLLHESSSQESLTQRLESLVSCCKSYRTACELMDSALGGGFFWETQNDFDPETLDAFTHVDFLYSCLEDLLHQIDVAFFVNIQSTGLPSSVFQLICFCPFGLVVRMRMLSLVSHTNPISLDRLTSFLCQFIHMVDQHQISSENQSIIRTELIRLASLLYGMSSNVVTLNKLLFAQVEQLPSGKSTLATDILETMACSNPEVFDFVFRFLCKEMDQSTCCPVAYRLISVLHTVAQSMLDPSPNEEIATRLCILLTSKAKLLLHLFDQTEPDCFLKIKQIGTVFRLTSAIASQKQQNSLLVAYDYTKTKELGSIPMRILSRCSIISGLRPQLIHCAEHLRSIKWLTVTCQMLQSLAESDTLQTIQTYLRVIAAEAFASVLNKVTEPFDENTSTALKTLTRILSKCSVDNPLTILHPWLVLFTLRALFENASPCCISEAQSLIDCLVPQHVGETSSSHMLVNGDFERFILKLIDDVHPGDTFSRFCHWRSANSLTESTFSLFGNRIKEQILKFMETTRLPNQTLPYANQLRDTYLSVWLKLCTHLPVSLIYPEMKEAIRFSLYAVTSSESTIAKTNALHLLCVLSDLAGSNTGDLWETLSPSDADALFSALPRVAESSYNEVKIASTSGHSSLPIMRANVETRISIARCLYCLHKLPSEISSRHRDVEVIPLLNQLIDDPNRSVRFAAVRAQNAWLM